MIQIKSGLKCCLLFLCFQFMAGLSVGEEAVVFVEDRSTVSVSGDDSEALDFNATQEYGDGKSASGSTPDSIYEVLQQVEQQQNQLRELLGLVEEQNHKIEYLKEQQKNRYLDLDHRLTGIEQRITALEETSLSSATTVSPANSTTTSPASTSANTLSLTDKTLYNKGKSLVLAKKFTESLKIFNQLLTDYPESEYVPYAHYWLGEVYMAVKPAQLDKAKLHFNTVKSDFSNHPKIPSVFYKLGVLYYMQKDNAQARLYLQRVKSQFPGTTEAKKAGDFLPRVK